MQSHTRPWEPSQADIDAKAWKYLGYQSFSAFVASDNDFFVLRRFGALSARVLLALQDELSRLEEQLEALEMRVREKDAPDIHNGSFRQETQDDRQALVREAQRLLREYSQSRSFLPSSDKEACCRSVIASFDTLQIHLGAAYTSLLFCFCKQTLTVAF